MNSKEKNNITFNDFADSKFNTIAGGQNKVMPEKEINITELIAILSNPLPPLVKSELPIFTTMRFAFLKFSRLFIFHHLPLCF